MQFKATLMATVLVLATPMYHSTRTPSGAQDNDITLFDSVGAPRAYIATDDELTIYLWDGQPVAYLDGTDIYGFNGTHLGWFEHGIVRDHDGRAVGFVEGAVSQVTQIEPIKSIRQIKPIKAIEEIAPIAPLFVSVWSATPLGVFLAAGSE